MTIRSWCFASTMLATIASAMPVWAQEASSVEELVVTAQRREQNLQDVPVVVTSLSAAALQNAGVHDIKDLTILTPGLTVTTTGSDSVTSARIRGVGTVGENPGLESAVGVVIDGVYRPRNGVSFGDLGEMDRIEVLKGPQGTLFGKNTTAGVINVMTKAPSFDPGAELELTAGNFNAYGAAASITGPLQGDSLAGRLYLAARKRDGFNDVITAEGPRSRTDDANQNFWTVRGQLLFRPSDSAEIRVIADYSKRDESCCTPVTIRSGNTAAITNSLATGGQGVPSPVTGGSFGPAPGYQMLPFSRTAYANRGSEQKVEDAGVSIEVNIDIASLNATLTSITAARDWSSVNGQDSDFSGADILWRDSNGDFGTAFETLSQEFRLTGETERLNWLVGAFFASEDLTRNDNYIIGSDYNNFLSQRLTLSAGPPLGVANRLGCFTATTFVASCISTGVGMGPVFGAGAGARDVYSQSDKTVALFTDNTLQVTDALDVTLGLRYTIDDKDLQTHQTNFGGAGVPCAAAMAGPVTSAAVGGAKTLICLPWANPGFDNRSTIQSQKEKAWSGTLKVVYRFNPDFMAYAAYARGFKAGGFNFDRSVNVVIAAPSFTATPVADTSFDGEFVDSYELGAKTTWFDQRLLINATAFLQQYSDFQLNTFLGTTFVVESMPEVESKGLDLDMIWFSPIEGLSVQGGMTYAETRYGDFTAADLSNPSRFPQLSLQPGAQLPFAPKWSASAAVGYERDLGGTLKLGFNLAAKYTSDFNTGSDLLPAKVQQAMTLLNGRINLASQDDRWTLELWAQNLTDEEYYQVVINQPLQGGAFQTTLQPSGDYYNPALDTQSYSAFLGQPRTWGATLRLRY